MGSWTLVSNNGEPSRIVKPVSVLIGRLVRDADGGILDGLIVKSFPAIRIDGVDDLPVIWPTEYTDSEESSIAGAKTNTGLSTNMVDTQATLSLMLSFNRENGMYSSDWGDKPYGYVDWVERVKDSLEKDDDAVPDLMLDSTCMSPMYTHVRDSEITDLAWSILFEVEFYPFPTQRSTRRYGWQYTEP